MTRASTLLSSYENILTQLSPPSFPWGQHITMSEYTRRIACQVVRSAPPLSKNPCFDVPRGLSSFNPKAVVGGRRWVPTSPLERAAMKCPQITLIDCLRLMPDGMRQIRQIRDGSYRSIDLKTKREGEKLTHTLCCVLSSRRERAGETTDILLKKGGLLDHNLTTLDLSQLNDVAICMRERVAHSNDESEWISLLKLDIYEMSERERVEVTARELVLTSWKDRAASMAGESWDHEIFEDEKIVRDLNGISRGEDIYMEKYEDYREAESVCRALEAEMQHLKAADRYKVRSELKEHQTYMNALKDSENMLNEDLSFREWWHLALRDELLNRLRCVSK